MRGVPSSSVLGRSPATKRAVREEGSGEEGFQPEDASEEKGRFEPLQDPDGDVEDGARRRQEGFGQEGDQGRFTKEAGRQEGTGPKDSLRIEEEDGHEEDRRPEDEDGYEEDCGTEESGRKEGRDVPKNGPKGVHEEEDRQESRRQEDDDGPEKGGREESGDGS